MELKIYIVGKITGEDTAACSTKFSDIEGKLKLMGAQLVVNPLKMGIPISWTWDQAKEKCLDVLAGKANAIFLLDDWVNSEGSQNEFYYAHTHGYRIFDKSDFDLIVSLIKHTGKWIDTSHHEFP